MGQACQTFWADEEVAEGGRWWLGSIVADRREGHNSDVLSDPYGCGGLWERFTVEWQGECVLCWQRGWGAGGGDLKAAGLAGGVGFGWVWLGEG